MRKVTTLCDICDKDCADQMSAFAGTLLKMNEKAEMGRIQFESHFCVDHTQRVLDYLTKLRNATDATGK